jgi:hypothetical protein
MRNGGRTSTNQPDRVIHAVGWLLLFLIALGLYIGREYVMVILWAVFS